MKITPHPNLLPHHALHVKHAGEKENHSVINYSSDYRSLRDHFASAVNGTLLGCGLVSAAFTTVAAANGNLLETVAAGIGTVCFTSLSLALMRGDARKNEFKDITALIACFAVGGMGLAAVYNNPFAKLQDQQPQSKLVAPAATPAPSAPTP
jgi:hypothetical protein